MGAKSPLMKQESAAVDAYPQLKSISAQQQPERLLKVMHVLSVSIPRINGYALRSKYIVESQADSGLVEPCVVTSPFYPGLDGTAEDMIIRGVPYYRVANPQDRGFWRNPRLLPFVLLHWAKRFVDWSIPLLRRGRRRSQRIVKKLFRKVKRVPRRFKRYLLRVTRCAQRVVKYTGFLIEAITEPVIGKRFMSAMMVISQWMLALLWLCSRPFEAPARFAVRTLRSRWRGLIDAVRRLWTRSATPPPTDRLGLRQRLTAYLQGKEKSLLIKMFQRELVRLSRKLKPDVIHVHSPYFCGVPAVKASKITGIPVVYEVRGIWEESGVAQGNFQRDSDEYRMWRREETWVMQNADAVTCICEELRKEIISRNVDAQRVFVASNAVDSSLFTPQSHSSAPAPPAPESVGEVRERLGKFTIGYIGSIRPLEGVDGLVRGAAEVIHRGYDATLLVVGGGKDVEELMQLAEDLGIGDRAIFTGQVPHDEVHFYYELIDIFVISRPASRVAKLVTPLKPLEAMAMEKALVVSDLPALRELVEDGRTGLIYRAEDAADLADKCGRLIEDDELRESLAKTAREWVCHERSWEQTIVPQFEAYATVVEEFTLPQSEAQRQPARAA